jgi:hypothetical protein
MKWKIGILAVTVVFFTGLIGFPFWTSNDNPFWLRNHWRKAWKNKAVTQIAQCSDNSAWVTSEVARLKAGSEGQFDSWMSRQMILMTNGEWMVYSSFCRKQDFRICDIFIARASDGKWYYSTYHFCINMIVLRDMHGQPGSLAEFTNKYSVRQFDGRSDECLQRTWP